MITLMTFALCEKEGSVGVTGLETTGVSVEGVTGLDNLVCLCGEEEVSDPVLRGPGVESVNGVVECCDSRNNKYFRENILDLPK
jgi:hypothetical protein